MSWETLLNVILAFLYDSWGYITAISSAVGVIAFVVAFKDKAESKSRTFGTLLNILVSICISFIVLSLAVGNLFSKVPDLSEKTIDEARKALSDCDLTLELSPNALIADNEVVVWQSHGANRFVVKGSAISVYTAEVVSDGDDKSPSEGFVYVPNVVGMEQMQAAELLTLSGLQFQVWWTDENSTSSDVYYVIDQSVPHSSQVPRGTIIKPEISADIP